MNKLVNIAGIDILIDTSHKVGKLLSYDLGAKENNKEENVDIIIKFNEIKIDAEVKSGNNCFFNKKEFVCKSLKPIVYKVVNLFDNEKTILEINFFSSSLKTKVQHLLYGKSILEKNIILSYSLFWYILQIELLKRNKTFLHAGIFSKNSEAIAITGTGGSGKTSGLFKVLENKEYKYLSEDFGIISTDLFTYYNPKPLSIYETDIVYNPKILSKTYNFLSFKDKIKWNIQVRMLNRNPIVKLNPEKLLSNQIEHKAKLKKVLYFFRTNTSYIKAYSLSKEELTERSLNVALREFKIIFEIFTLLNANRKKEYNFLTVDEFIAKIRILYLKIFEKTENYLIEIPFNERPENIISFLKKEGIVH